jgi:hypothetical protein
MLRGFQLLETYLPNEKVDVEEIEKKLGFSLPPMYKLFVKTYRLGKNSFKEEFFLNPTWNAKYTVSVPLYEPLENDERWFLSLPYFDSIDDVCDFWLEYKKGEREWMEYRFLRISGIDRGGGIYVGTTPQDLDIIYQVVWDDEDYYMKLADNIFEFIKGFVLRERKSKLSDGYLPSQLYKNYGEDIWRVREE